MSLQRENKETDKQRKLVDRVELVSLKRCILPRGHSNTKYTPHRQLLLLLHTAEQDKEWAAHNDFEKPTQPCIEICSNMGSWYSTEDLDSVDATCV